LLGCDHGGSLEQDFRNTKFQVQIAYSTRGLIRIHLQRRRPAGSGLRLEPLILKDFAVDLAVDFNQADGVRNDRRAQVTIFCTNTRPLSSLLGCTGLVPSPDLPFWANAVAAWSSSDTGRT